MTNQPWKLVLLLAGIFVFGAVAGGVTMMFFGRGLLQKRAMPEQWGPARLTQLSKHLDLTPQQIETLRPVMRRNVDELAKLRQQSMGETRRVLERLEREIAAQLTPEQKEKFEKLNAEHRERARRFLEQRRGEGGKRRERPPGADEAPPPASSGEKPPGGDA